jgi:hypothetical protein
MSLERRIRRLEQAEQRRQTWENYRMVSAEYGFDPHELMDEAEEFFAMPLDQQLAEVDRLAAARFPRTPPKNGPRQGERGTHRWRALAPHRVVGALLRVSRSPRLTRQGEHSSMSSWSAEGS